MIDLRSHLQTSSAQEFKDKLSKLVCKVSFWHGRKFSIEEFKGRVSFNELCDIAYHRYNKQPAEAKTISTLLNALHQQGETAKKRAKFFTRFFTILKQSCTFWKRKPYRKFLTTGNVVEKLPLKNSHKLLIKNNELLLKEDERSSEQNKINSEQTNKALLPLQSINSFKQLTANQSILNTLKAMLITSCNAPKDIEEPRLVVLGNDTAYLFFKVKNPNKSCWINYPVSGDKNQNYIYYKSPALKIDTKASLNDNLQKFIEIAQLSIPIWKSIVDGQAELFKNEEGKLGSFATFFKSQLPSLENVKIFLRYSSMNFEFTYDNTTQELNIILDEMFFNFEFDNQISLITDTFKVNKTFECKNPTSNFINSSWEEAKKIISSDNSFKNFLHTNIVDRSPTNTIYEELERVRKQFTNKQPSTFASNSHYANLRDFDFGFGINSANLFKVFEKIFSYSIQEDNTTENDPLFSSEGEISVDTAIAIIEELVPPESQEESLSKNLTVDTLKKFRKKGSLKYHPDKAPADLKDEFNEKFIKFTNAYGIVEKHLKNRA